MRDLLDEAIGTAPASTVDIDAVIATARRRNRLRLLAPTGAAAVAVVAVSVGIGVVAAGPAHVPVAIDPPPTTTHGVSPSLDPPASEEERLAAVLTDLLSAAVPGIEIQSQIWPDWAASPSPWTTGVTVTRDEAEGTYSLEATMLLTAGDASGVLTFRVSPGSNEPPSCAEFLDSPTDECDTLVGPQGQRIVSHSTQADGRTVRGALAFWPDATVYLLLVDSGSLPGDPARTATMPLTLDQLERIVADPRLAQKA